VLIMTQERPQHGALSRFTVLELTVARAGPTCGRQLADWGANVIKIEPPSAGNETSLASALGQRHGSDFQNLHRNRRGLTLNLKHPGGIATLLRMAERADVLIENFRPDVKHRLGFDYEILAQRNPRLVYASISGFGQDGPYGARPGVDQIAQGMGGLMAITGEPEGRPTRVGIAISDVAAGMALSFGILAALLEREVSGKGQWVRTSLLQTQIYLLDFQAARWLQEGEIAAPTGNDHPTIRPQGLFKAADGYFNIATVPSMWGILCKVLGLDQYERHPDFATREARMTNSARLTELIENVTARDKVDAWVEKLNAAGIPSGPVYRMNEVFADPQVQHLRIAQPVSSRTLGELHQVRQPLDFSRTPSELWTGAPELGEHTSEVLLEFGFSASEIDRLRQEEAI
jgi:crotonobetainyl-CoA:carnitine CoA-transferase CaiB-like acyl-CoA transferase